MKKLSLAVLSFLISLGTASAAKMELYRAGKHLKRVKMHVTLNTTSADPQLLGAVRAGGRADMSKEPDANGCRAFAEPLPDMMLTVPAAGDIKFTVAGSPLATIVIVGPDGALKCSAPANGFEVPELTINAATPGIYQVRVGMPRGLLGGYVGTGSMKHGDNEYFADVQVFAQRIN